MSSNKVPSIYELKIGDQPIAISNWSILRVPGGWIYSFSDFNNLLADNMGDREPNYRTHSVYVPLNQQAKEEQMEALLQR